MFEILHNLGLGFGVIANYQLSPPAVIGHQTATHGKTDR